MVSSAELLGGIVLGLAVVAITYRQPPKNSYRQFAWLLLIAACVYPALALTRGASARSTALEAGVALAFGLLAWLGYKYSPLTLALGWAAHGVWDLWLHASGAGASYTPAWYPFLCLSFDLVIAVRIVAMSRAASRYP